MAANGNENFLTLAEQADRAAEKATTPDAKRSWQVIAREYRLLAAEHLANNRPPKPSNDRS